MPAPRRSPPRPAAQRFLLGFGVTALALSGVMLWEPLMGSSATVDACGGYPCPPPPTYTATTPPPPPPPPPTQTPTKVPYPTKTPVPPTATTPPPPPPPPPTATPTNTKVPYPTKTPSPTATTPPPPPPPPTATNTPTATPTEKPTKTPTATATVPPPPPPPPPTPTATATPIPEGCTPGFWKQEQHFGAWAVDQDVTLEDVFNVPNSLDMDDVTLLEALQGGGGSGVQGAAKILFRAATAAYLNSLNPEISYPLTSAQVISQVNTAIATLDRNTILTLAGTLDTYNNAGCPSAPSLVIEV